MKALKIALIILLPVSFVFGGLLALERPAAATAEQAENDAEMAQDTMVEVNEVALLLEYLSGKDIYLHRENMEEALSVSASEVFENLDNRRYHLVDLRNPEDFYPLHIPGAVLVEQPLLYDYLKSIPLDYIEKVVLICYAGQRASYVTGLLRLLGIEDVYFLRWGMSAWQGTVARDNWLRNLSNEYAGNLVKPLTSAPADNELPMIFTFKTTGEEILHTRIVELLQEEFANARIRANEVMADPMQFQIVVADPKLKPEYTMAPEGSVMVSLFDKANTTAQLNQLLPFNPIAIASVNGQTGGLVAAFLRTLGYDARFITSGLSAMAVNALQQQNLPVFNLNEVKNFSTIATAPPVKTEAPRRAVAGC